MKKYICISVLSFLMFVSLVWGTILPPFQTTLNSSTYTAVRLPSNMSCQNFAFWVEDGTSFYLSSDSAGTDNVLVPADTKLAVQEFHNKGTVLFYAKASSGTPIIAVLITK